MDLTTYTDSDLDELRVQVLTEQERRRIIAATPAQQKAVAERYAAAVAATAPTPWASLGDRVGPGQRVIWNGNTWLNTSGAWLPTTATPATWPQGWSQETGLPSAVTAWKAGEAVKVGDLRSASGVTYRCLQAHTTQIGWEPAKVPALWTPQG